jgi:MFS family permease
MTAAATGVAALPAIDRARMLGFQTLAGSASGVAIHPTVGALAHGGWRLPFIIHLLALIVLPMAAALPRDTAKIEKKDESSSSAKWRIPTGLLLVVLFAGMTAFIGGMYSPFYLNSIGIREPLLISIPLVASSIGSMFASGFYGRLSLRFDTRRIFSSTLLLIGAGLLIGGRSSALPLFTVGIVVYSLGQTAFAPNIIAIAIADSKGDPARAIGIMYGALFGGPVLFPFIAGFINQFAGPACVFLCFGAAALLLAVCYDPRRAAR